MQARNLLAEFYSISFRNKLPKNCTVQIFKILLKKLVIIISLFHFPFLIKEGFQKYLSKGEFLQKFGSLVRLSQLKWWKGNFGTAVLSSDEDFVGPKVIGVCVQSL